MPDSAPSTTNGQTCTGESEIVTQDDLVNLRRLPIDDCTFKTNGMAASPDGGVTLIGGLGGSSNAYDDSLLHFDGSGAQTYPNGGVDLNQVAGYSNLRTFAPVVDADGNTVVMAIGTQSGTQDRNVIVSKIGASGARTILYTTATNTTESNGDIDKFGGSTVELTNGGVYLAVCGPTPYLTYCNNGDQIRLVRIYADVQYAYPKSAVFAAAPHKLNYVAMGDSFSAGEGVPPFIAPSDTNGCHRSGLAYPKLVSEMTPAMLNLQAFVACSGAKTGDMTTDGVEVRQLNALSTLTDVVTLSAGGNDVGFKHFATECVVNVVNGCNKASPAYSDITYNIENGLVTKLYNLYLQVLDRAPNAHLYVMEYPAVVGVYGPPSQPTCAPFDNSNLQVPADSEVDAVHDVISKLNSAIGSAVLAVKAENPGSRISAVPAFTRTNSAFVGHGLCTQAPYFTNVEYPQSEYSFHPNADGQGAYGEELRAAMNP